MIKQAFDVLPEAISILSKTPLWTKDNYELFLASLKSLKDEKMIVFSRKFIFTKYEILGLRSPLIKKIIKSVAKVDNFVDFAEFIYHEEIIIVLGYFAARNDFEGVVDIISNYADCWAHTDMVKLSFKDKKAGFLRLKELVSSSKEYVVRFGFVIMLGFYIRSEEYYPQIETLILELGFHTYYIDMAIAWLLQDAYLGQPEKLLTLLSKKRLPKFIQNKAISKLRDSFRTSVADKALIVNYRI
ncbi:MAG: DNA alkylation repair protein [Erysipelotrichaceae bacterium]|jgi:3-methyladenine DNA glycosylase AlkD|nr:DNA alkylation repair protein [Erysipelotrichaceae bacterium]